MKKNMQVGACQMHKILRNKIAVKYRNHQEKSRGRYGMIFLNRHDMFVASMPQIYRRGLFGWL